MNVLRHEFDTIVVGSGPAGQRAANYLATKGKSVIMVNPEPRMGSLKLDLSTGSALPFYTFREAVLYLSGDRHRAFYGNLSERAATRRVLSRQAIQHRIESVAQWNNEQAMTSMKLKGVSLMHGSASFVDSHTIMVDRSKNSLPKPSLQISAKSFILATGSKSIVDPKFPLDDRFITSCDRFLNLNQPIPLRPIIIGATVEGIQFASVLAALPDTVVRVVDKLPEAAILPTIDSALRSSLLNAMCAQKTEFIFGQRAIDIEIHQSSVLDPVRVKLDDATELSGDIAIFAQNKCGNTEFLNLDAAGVSRDERGFVSVTRHMQTEVGHIYAIGNVIGHSGVSYISSQQGLEAARHILQDPDVFVHSLEDDLIPITINSIPAISRVGPTEDALRTLGRPFVVGKAFYDELAKGQLLGQRQGLMKMLICPSTTELLAVHTFGESAVELVHIGQAVLAHRGSAEYFVTSTWNFPSYAEAYRTAALDGLSKCHNGRAYRDPNNCI